MALSHLLEYCNKQLKTYEEMTKLLDNMNDDLQDVMIPPERTENLKNILRPLQQNYEYASFIMYLLNKPTNKKKAEKYEIQNVGRVSKYKNEEVIHQENDAILRRLKNKEQFVKDFLEGDKE